MPYLDHRSLALRLARVLKLEMEYGSGEIVGGVPVSWPACSPTIRVLWTPQLFSKVRGGRGIRRSRWQDVRIEGNLIPKSGFDWAEEHGPLRRQLSVLYRRLRVISGTEADVEECKKQEKVARLAQVPSPTLRYLPYAPRCFCTATAGTYSARPDLMPERLH